MRLSALPGDALPGVASPQSPAPRACRVRWGERRGGPRRWAGRGNREERAGRVCSCSCPCRALERGRAGARAGGKPARAAVVGWDRRGGEVTCERASVRARRVRIAPASLGPHTPCEAGARVGDKEESQPGRRRPPAPGRVGAAGVGARRAAAPGRGGEGSENFAGGGSCGPGRGRGGGGAGGGGRRHVGVCGKRGAPGRLPCGLALGLEPPGFRRARPRRPGAWDPALRRAPSGGALGFGPADRGLGKLCGDWASGARCDFSSAFYVTL